MAQSNSPQAWSASAVVLLIQTLLGIYPFAPANLLALVRPRLPAWVSQVTVHRLRVGDAVVSLRFRRAARGLGAATRGPRSGSGVPAGPPERVGREA
jgi:hypothetical protein